MAKLRHIARLMLPWWLFVEDGQKVAQAYALLVDAFRQKLRDGLDARFPSRAGESAAKLIGDYRLIPRGRAETLEHYAQRLIAWRNPRGHRVRGSAPALLTQVYHYWGGVPCWTHDVNQNYRALDADEGFSYAYGVAWDWDGGAASNWGRQWVVVDLSDTAYAQSGFVDGGTIGIGGTLPGDWVSMRRLVDAADPHRWMAAGTQPEWMIVSLDGTDPTPDSTWADWAVLDGDTLVPSRVERAEIGYDLSAWTATNLTVGGDLSGFTLDSFAGGLSFRRISKAVTGLAGAAEVSFNAVAGTIDWLYVTGTDGAGDYFNLWLDLVSREVGSSYRCSAAFDGDRVFVSLLSGAVTSITIAPVDANEAGGCTPAGAETLATVWGMSDLTRQTYRFVTLRSELRDYAGDPTRFPTAAVSNAGAFVGDPTSFPATITLPDGTAYAGDPTQFHATITLPDDGDRIE